MKLLKSILEKQYIINVISPFKSAFFPYTITGVPNKQRLLCVITSFDHSRLAGLQSLQKKKKDKKTNFPYKILIFLIGEYSYFDLYDTHVSQQTTIYQNK